MTLRDIGEFGLIERIAARFSTVGTEDGSLGIGDDCAVLSRNRDELDLVTTDLLIEGSHFLRDAISPRLLGRKSVAVNLSDICAMGGECRSAFLALALPGELSVAWIDAFFDGVQERLREAGVKLLGGDTTRSNGPIVIQFTILGSVSPAHLKLRRTAREQDLICVTDCLGDSGGGLRALLEGVARNSAVEYLIERHLDPCPQLAEGAWLAASSDVHAMMDISDGLDSDIRRIMEQSRVGARIEVEHLPLSSQLREVAAEQAWSAWELAVSGGEDYVLLCTVAPERHAALAEAFQRRFGRELRAVGRITDRPGQLVYLRDGVPMDPSKLGFDHFRTE